MSNTTPTDYSVEPNSIAQFEQIRSIVTSEFLVEDSFLENGVPTFHVKPQDESKQSFLRLVKRLDDKEFAPILREINGKTVLRVIPKPPVKPSRWIINVILLIATVGTTLATGYILSEGAMSNPMAGAVAFTVAIMSILGSHEMGHKVAANMHGVEATMPYFIPGPPPIRYIGGIGTFGAVIKQKSLPPNRDALFDLGVSGPIIGFIVTIVVLMIGVPMSNLEWVTAADVPPSALPMSLLLEFFTGIFLTPPTRPTPSHRVLLLHLHPVAFAGFIGLLVTMLNLLPTGMLDGGHTVRSLLGKKAHSILLFVSLAILFLLGPFFWPFAFIVLILSMYRHPGPLDDVSKLTTSRKLVAVVLVIIFILSVPRTLF